MREFHPFLMERMMSKFEQQVEYNLSESGVHPVSLRELLTDEAHHIEELLDTCLNYPHVNGIPQLRENIAALYDGAGADNVLVTVGAIEANYNTIRTLLSAGDEIVIMIPNYMQIWGVAMNHGLDVKTFSLREENGWAPDLAELEEKVTTRTKLIAVCNPNNPTGHVLAGEDMDAIVTIADRTGAWILSDEVYSGAERIMDEETPSFYGRYKRVVAVGSLSKAYGLPGLRLGWAVAPVDTVDDIWARHEYTTLSATVLSNKLAAIALSPQVRPRLIERARRYIRDGYPVLQRWMDGHEHTFRIVPPHASAIAFARYDLPIDSTALVDRLVQEKSVLIVPGNHFGMDRFLRISFGLPRDYMVPALDRIHELITDLGAK
jgi:aspartate/methionine/tyrosine aminotransferase